MFIEDKLLKEILNTIKENKYRPKCIAISIIEYCEHNLEDIGTW